MKIKINDPNPKPNVSDKISEAFIKLLPNKYKCTNILSTSNDESYNDLVYNDLVYNDDVNEPGVN